jgi:phosphoribosylaminoimidazole-succinocarboxamide synthase
VTPGPAVTATDIKLPVFSKGKVRDTYELAGDRLLMVATDRLSAFDHVLPNGIPDRGKVLTQLSIFWFSQTHEFQENHLISGMVPDLPVELRNRIDDLVGRFMIVRRAQRIDIECVVRGYLAGSGWKEYRSSGTLAGEALPAGLQNSSRLPELRFTPAAKNDEGHDENISRAQLADSVGAELAQRLEDVSLRLFTYATEECAKAGLILCDTKFEFGWVDGELTLIDEVFTPDSSRFWEASTYREGIDQPSFDKQFVRDYLETLDWDKTPPGPELPDEVVARTRDKYREAARRLCGIEIA